MIALLISGKANDLTTDSFQLFFFFFLVHDAIDKGVVQSSTYDYNTKNKLLKRQNIDRIQLKYRRI